MKKPAMTTLRRVTLSSLAFPLALALAACGGGTEEATVPEGDPIAAIAAPAGAEWGETAALTPEGGYVIGNPDAPLKLVEYASHTCSHCADFSVAAAATLRDKYVASGVVSYEIRNLIRDPLDLTISTLARCSGPQAYHPLAEQAWAQFGPIVEQANANQAAMAAAMEKTGPERFQAIGEASGLIEFFAARGLSRDQSMQCLADVDNITKIAEQSDKQSTEQNITGTPSFFLNGARLNMTTWDALEPVLQAAGAR